MDNNNSEDSLAELSIEGEELKKKEPEQKKTIELSHKNEAEKTSEQIIKSNLIINTEYNSLGEKEVIEGTKDGKIKKATEYYAGGFVKSVTNYGNKGSYTVTTYNIDGSKQSFMQKFEDGTSEAIYYNVDSNGSNAVVKFDKDKNPIEKKIEKN